MPIFIVYDGEMIWQRAFKTFDEAWDEVVSAVNGYNDAFKSMEDWDGEWVPAKMEAEVEFKDSQGGVLVAFNECTKLSTFIKQLDL